MRCLDQFFYGGVFLLIIFFGSGCANQTNPYPFYPLIESQWNGVELQGRIWSLEEAGEFEEADRLKEIVRQTLISGHCNIEGRQGGGASNPYFLVCDHGIKGVFKVKNIPFPYHERTAAREAAGLISPSDVFYPLSDVNAELAAYALGELLTLRMIPITVSRTVLNLGFGSIQYFFRNGRQGEGDLSTPGFRKMKIFDFIIKNEDRWSGNWLYSENFNRIIAIDHGRSFRSAHSACSLGEVVDYLQQELSLAQRLQTVTDQEVFNSLREFISLHDLQGVQDRIHQIQNALSERRSGNAGIEIAH